MICTVTNHPYKIIHDQITNVILDGTNKVYTYNLPYKITQEQLIANKEQTTRKAISKRTRRHSVTDNTNSTR